LVFYYHIGFNLDNFVVPSSNNYTELSDEYFISLALKEAEKSLKYNDVPIGALIVRENDIIAKSHNKIERYGNPILHAEMLAIHSATAKIGYKHLYDCTLYVNLEPCIMCSGAIVLARLKRVVFGAYDIKTGGTSSLYAITSDERLNHRCEVAGGILQDECSMFVKNFFKELRQKKEMRNNLC